MLAGPASALHAKISIALQHKDGTCLPLQGTEPFFPCGPVRPDHFPEKRQGSVWDQCRRSSDRPVHTLSALSPEDASHKPG